MFGTEDVADAINKQGGRANDLLSHYLIPLFKQAVEGLGPEAVALGRELLEELRQHAGELVTLLGSTYQPLLAEGVFWLKVIGVGVSVIAALLALKMLIRYSPAMWGAFKWLMGWVWWLLEKIVEKLWALVERGLKSVRSLSSKFIQFGNNNDNNGDGKDENAGANK